MSTTLATRYACMPRHRLELGTLAVEAVRATDIEPIRCWRNSQLRILRQDTPISPDEQSAYYQKYVWPDMASAQPKNILLAYLEHGELIGYGGLVHIAWRHQRAEVSFLLRNELAGTEQDHSYYFPAFLRMMKTLAFEDLGLHRLCTETYAIRPQYIAALERSGFRLEGVLKHHVRIDDQPVDSFVHGCLRSYGSQ